MDERKRPAGHDSGQAGTSPDRRTTGDGSITLYSSRYRQTYHSLHGAASESQHVFLEGSGVRELLANDGRAKVLEVGFGTGLNFLLSAEAALSSGGTLDYVALERDLLPAETLQALGYQELAPSLSPELLQFRRQLPESPAPGRYTLSGPCFGLELRLGEATRLEIEPNRFDAVFHDAFSPDANEELWTEQFLGRLARSLRPGGVLVSYTVKGTVRRALAAQGLEVSKLPGPRGGKREMLRATRPSS